MLLHNTLPVLFLLLCHYFCAVDGALSMTQWTVQSRTQVGNDRPTWYSETSAFFLPGGTVDGLLDYSGVLNVAHLHYDWLQGQKDAVTTNGACMVAAFWDPNTKQVYASSIPQGIRKRAMVRESSTNGAAPVWYSQVKPFMGQRNPPLHAEDGVFFNWETSTGAQTANGKYPAGSIIAVWGKFASDGTDREISLCKTVNNRNPTCQAVATALDVWYSGSVQETPQQAQEDNSADEFGDDLTDAEWNEILETACPTGGQSKRRAIRGAGLMRRDNTTCILFPFPSDVSPSAVSMTLPLTDFDVSTSTTTTGPTTADPGSTPSCSMQDQDPDQGITSAACVCDQTITLPLLSAPSTAMATESCHYTTIPTLLPTITDPGLGPATTDIKNCQVCTPVVNNEDSCTSMNGCIVQTGAVTVQAGSSPVHVGTLTSTELYTSVSDALETLCPSATQTTSMTACSTDSVTIQNVPYVDGGFLAQGELIISVESSQYNVTSLRDAMIQSAALTAQNAATGKNCYDQEYSVENLKARRDHPYPQAEKATWCNTVGFAGVNYYDPFWRVQQSPGATDWIDARWSFSTGPGGDFACELLQDLVDAFAVVEPEFAVGDIELGEAIDVICQGELNQD